MNGRIESKVLWDILRDPKLEKEERWVTLAALHDVLEEEGENELLPAIRFMLKWHWFPVFRYGDWNWSASGMLYHLADKCCSKEVWAFCSYLGNFELFEQTIRRLRVAMDLFPEIFAPYGESNSMSTTVDGDGHANQ